ncbi:MAG: hypothetical protein J6Y69_03045 [Treponema sp.]|nr:hypothetical protein [Treponema sp.]
MFGSGRSIEKAQKEFYEEFERKYGRAVQKLEFAQLRGSNKAFSDLNLVPYMGELTLSGVLVFCSDSLYFYSFPKESYMGIVKKDLYDNPDNVSQCICLSELRNIKAEFPKQGRFSFLFPEKSRNISFSAQGPSSTIYFTLAFLKKADMIYQEITGLLKA